MIDFEKVEPVVLGTNDNDKEFFTIGRKLFYAIFCACIAELFTKKHCGDIVKLSNYAIPSIGNAVQNFIGSYGLMLSKNDDCEYIVALCEIDKTKENEAITPLGVITLGSLKGEKMFTSYAAYSLSIMLMFYMQTSFDLALIK